MSVGDNNQARSLVRVAQTGNYSCRAAMFTTWCVFLSCAFLSVSSESYLLKCCPPRQLYSGSSETVDCVPILTNVSMELHVLYSNSTPKPQGHPQCLEPEDLVTTALDDFVSGDYLEVPACLEILHDQKTGESAAIVVHCRSGKDRHVEAISAPFPWITRIRQCCPRDMAFDRRTKTCVPRPTNSPSLLTLLPNESVGEDRVVITTNGPPRCEGPIVDYEVDEDDVFLRNGTYSVMIPAIKHGSTVKETYTITKDNACFDTTPPRFPPRRRLVARVCEDRKYCDENACVRKCCAEDEHFYAPQCRRRVTTEEEPAEFHQVLVSTVNTTQSSTFDASKGYGLLIGKPCLHGMYPVNPTKERLSVTSKGHVKVEGYPIYNLDKYCMDNYYNKSDYNQGLHLFVCFDKPGPARTVSTSHKVNIVLEFTSCAFLLMTLLVYACLPSLQNLHGKTLMCHVSSLLLAFTCLAAIPWITPPVAPDKEELKVTIPCKALAYIMLFFFLSAFSWLNVMCFDIWWTFGGLRGDTVTRGRKHRRRFLLYCLYAWGFSFLVSMSAIVSDCTDILPVYVRPNVGHMGCWFTQISGMYGEVIYFIGPVTIQLVSNVVFFVLTSMHCNKVKAEIKRVASDQRSKRFHSDRNRFAMNIKLFVVMGMSWVCEVVSFFLKKYHLEWQDAIFYASDVFNCLQGLLIFILFVLKSRVYLALRRRLGLDVGQKRACNTTTLQDPYRVRKSASNSTLMSTFAVSSAP